MNKYIKAFFVAATLILIYGGASIGQAENIQKGQKSMEDKNMLIMSLDSGQVFIKLRPDLAPNHVERIKDLAGSGFYDGLVFHRVIDGFMAQTGDPTGTGTGGSGQNIKAEFSTAPFVRGTVGMARAQHEDSADSQFFITFDDAQFLNRKYTVFGNVVSGMEHVDKIKRGEPPVSPDKILWMRLASEKEAEMENDLEVPDFIDSELRPENYKQ